MLRTNMRMKRGIIKYKRKPAMLHLLDVEQPLPHIWSRGVNGVKQHEGHEDKLASEVHVFLSCNWHELRNTGSTEKMYSEENIHKWKQQAQGSGI